MKNSCLISILLAAVFLCNISYAQLPSYLPTNGLVAWYPFNGNANDGSGNGNNATNNGGVPTIDRNNNPQAAYSFASGYVSVNSGGFGSASFTFSAWAKPNSITGNGFGDIGGTYFNYQGYFVGIQNGIPKARIHSSVNNSIQEVASAQAVLPNVWYHITITHETPILKIYVNGINTGTVNTGTFQFTNRNSFAIGRSPWVLNESQSSFPGSIDDVAIYNRALTPTEINSVYTNSTGNTGGGTTTTSPVPPGIPYQAEVRNDSGEVLANANVNIRFTLHELTANGAVSYQETHALTTNELGLFAANIGAGTAVQGTFASINWAQTTKFLKVEVDTDNGWITMGNQQLMSVPYALYAANGPVGPQGEMGPQGSAGTPGVSGLNSLIQTTSVIPGANCSNGGVKIETGLDLNSNNVLEENEINHAMTKYVCNANDLSSNGISYTRVEYFMDPGTFNWQVPAGVTKIWVKCLGGGGAAGNGVNCMGGGGGSGGYAEGLVNVTPMMNLTINVGQGGAAGSIPTNGGNSSVGNLIVGGGGQAGGNGSTINGGAGGIGGISSGINCFLLNGSPGSSNCNSSLPGIPKITMPFPSIQFENSKVYGIGGQSTYNNIGFSGRSGFVVISY